ncbi:hypothetical protein SAMN05216436_1409 [bacterium A37T11]|nr:hypothetical protein SAMN05216436_1409 [bacterium A37T11]
MRYKSVLLVSMCIITSSLTFNACKDGNANGTKTEASLLGKKFITAQNLNISILLDLSDRIDPKRNPSPSMEFYRRDLGYIESISNAFEGHLRSKPIIKINDQIQVYFEPEPLNAEINSLAKKLRLSFSKNNLTKESIKKMSTQFTSISEQIYKLAINDKKYLGADIWGFFKNKVKDYCIKPDHRNILFILTDGYMFHEDSKFMEGNRSSYLTSPLIKALKLQSSEYCNLIKEKGYGFVKATEGLTNLEVVILGINPAKGNPFEGDVINAFWTNWLQSMNVKGPITKPMSADLPSNLDPVIQKYINY